MTSTPSRRTRKSNVTQDADVQRLMVPPHSVEAEQAVLGAMMLVPETYDRVADRLVATDFYRRDHQAIFLAIRDLADANTPFDAVTMGEWFHSQGKGELVADGAYLIELATTTPSAANVKGYAEVVRKHSLTRRLIAAATDIVNEGFNLGRGDVEELLAGAEQKIFAVGEESRLTKRDTFTLKQAAKAAVGILQDHFNRGGGITGLATGFDEFDDLTAGIDPTDLVIIAARPAMGKTTLALNIAENVAQAKPVVEGGKRKVVAVFSMEMSAEQLSLRSISKIGRIDANRLRRAELEDEDWTRLTHAIRVITEDITMLIDDASGMSPDVLRAKARRMKREEPELSLIVIDYLQLMSVPGNTENRATEISEISRALKGLAMELKVPVIALSQLNRGVESRADKRPLMSDLRESGAIEQDADKIVFIYRDDYYNKESPEPGIAELILAKNRAGKTGTARVRFEGAYNAFDNIRSPSF